MFWKGVLVDEWFTALVALWPIAAVVVAHVTAVGFAVAVTASNKYKCLGFCGKHTFGTGTKYRSLSGLNTGHSGHFREKMRDTFRTVPQQNAGHFQNKKRDPFGTELRDTLGKYIKTLSGLNTRHCIVFVQYTYLETFPQIWHVYTVIIPSCCDLKK